MNANITTSKLAIVIPAYNCEATVRHTLQSLQNIQHGWEHVESVIVCDDASSDRTFPVLQSESFDRCPLTLLRHEMNRGEAACYDTMLDACSDETKWFLILHSDDLALENFLERNIDILRQCDDRVAAVSSNYYIFGRGAELLAHAPAEDTIIFRGNDESDIAHTALVGCWWHISGSLINRRLWHEFGGRHPKLPQAGDWDLMLRWQNAGFMVGHSLIPTTKYRLNARGSVSSQSYLRFRDVRERTEVILGLPEIFSANMRIKLAGQIATSVVRRICKFAAIGKFSFAAGGILVGTKCVFSLLTGQGLNSKTKRGRTPLKSDI